MATFEAFFREDFVALVGCSEAAVRVHLHRAHRRLAERMGEVSGVAEAAALEAPR
jgi:DNA-directed RNA polymerase specialized sigma24 family protein